MRLQVELEISVGQWGSGARHGWACGGARLAGGKYVLGQIIIAIISSRFRSSKFDTGE